jgi:hypothetical protein
MKRTTCVAALLLLIGATCWAQSKASFSSYYDGKRYEFAITKKMLDQTPVWSESAEAPPLAPKRAAQIAQQNLSVFVPNGAKWSLHNIRLSPIQNAWVYVAEFLEPLPEDGPGLYFTHRTNANIQSRGFDEWRSGQANHHRT